MTQLIPTKRKNLNGSLTFVVCVNNVPSFASLSKSAKTRDLLHYYSQWVMTSFLALHLLKYVHVRLNLVQQQSVILFIFAATTKQVELLISGAANCPVGTKTLIIFWMPSLIAFFTQKNAQGF